MNAKRLFPICLTGLLAAAAMAGPPAWKWRTETLPATNAAAYSLGVRGAQVSEVRARNVSGGTNAVSLSVFTVSAADSYTNTLAGFGTSSTNAMDRFTNLCWRAEATNAMCLAADSLRVAPSGVTNGVVTVGFWYWE